MNIDSPDHEVGFELLELLASTQFALQSHIVHPEAPIDPASGLTFYRGKCPPSHRIRMPLLIFETIWDTRQFNGMWPKDGSQPFVYSMGDP